MADDDEFGDLYVDVFRPPPLPSQTFSLSAGGSKPRGTAKPGVLDSNFLFEEDEDEEEDAKGTIPRVSDSYVAPISAASSLGTAPPGEGRGQEDWMVGGARNVEDESMNWSEEESVGLGRVSSPKREYSSPERNEFRFSLDEEEEDVKPSILDVSRVRVKEENDEEIPRSTIKVEKTDLGVEDDDQKPIIPGLSVDSFDPSASRGMNVKDEKNSGSEDLESDSEDDLQIVLNDDSMYGQEADGVEDEDEEEDLVIVTDADHLHHHHHHLSVDEQEYGDNLNQASLDGERNEALESSKVNGGISGVGARIGYSGHGFHGQHHSQFKYIRPGAGLPAGLPGSSAPGQTRPPLGPGPLNSLPRGMQKSYGAPTWGGNINARLYTGLDFTLPSHKTIFDVDIDGFEEKPWKIPGVDISDFFNFGLDEDSWKDYRKLLEQLRLEATMQSKIRVYESGRSEQDYDPDLPPELAAATGVQDIYSDSAHHAKADGGSFEMQPMGRAIQVEGGYGDRLPSVDTRRPRMRDSDAIIEIIPIDSYDDSIASNGEKDYELEEQQRVALDLEYSDRMKPDFSERKREMVERKDGFRRPEVKESQRPVSDIKSVAQGYSPANEETTNAKEDSFQVQDGEINKNRGFSEMSSPPKPEEPSVDIIIEGDPNEKVALDDGDDMDYEERASDLPVINEVHKENGSLKSSARDDQKATHSAGRRGKSENRGKDYSRKLSEERRSSQKRDDYGRDVGHGDKLTNSSKGRQDLSESYQGRKSEGLEKSRERDDDNGRRTKHEDASRQRDKARVSEKRVKDESLSRKHEDSDRKRQTDRDDVRKRKDEEQRRREKDMKDHSQHGSDHRKREDQLKEGSNKRRDDSWKQREKEESQRVKQPNEEGKKLKEREDRVSSGGGKGSERNSSRDRKRYPEKGTEQTEKHKPVENRSHENQSSSKERKDKQSKSRGEVEHRRSGDTKKTERESQKESSRKKKESEASERKSASGKRKREGRSQAGSSKSTHAPHEKSNSSHIDALPDVHDPHNTLSLPLPPPPPLPFPPPANLMVETTGSDEDNTPDGKKGRSKLERWTSQKEREFETVETTVEASEKVGSGELLDAPGKEKERHLETVAKLKKRSERFKVPLPGEKETVALAAVGKKMESEAVQEMPNDGDIKQERPARKRRWSSSG